MPKLFSRLKSKLGRPNGVVSQVEANEPKLQVRKLPRALRALAGLARISGPCTPDATTTTVLPASEQALRVTSTFSYGGQGEGRTTIAVEQVQEASFEPILPVLPVDDALASMAELLEIIKEIGGEDVVPKLAGEMASADLAAVAIAAEETETATKTDYIAQLPVEIKGIEDNTIVDLLSTCDLLKETDVGEENVYRGLLEIVESLAIVAASEMHQRENAGVFHVDARGETQPTMHEESRADSSSITETAQTHYPLGTNLLAAVENSAPATAPPTTTYPVALANAESAPTLMEPVVEPDLSVLFRNIDLLQTAAPDIALVQLKEEKQSLRADVNIQVGALQQYSHSLEERIVVLETFSQHRSQVPTVAPVPPAAPPVPAIILTSPTPATVHNATFSKGLDALPLVTVDALRSVQLKKIPKEATSSIRSTTSLPGHPFRLRRDDARDSSLRTTTASTDTLPTSPSFVSTTFSSVFRFGHRRTLNSQTSGSTQSLARTHSSVSVASISRPYPLRPIPRREVTEAPTTAPRFLKLRKAFGSIISLVVSSSSRILPASRSGNIRPSAAASHEMWGATIQGRKPEMPEDNPTLKAITSQKNSCKMAKVACSKREGVHKK